MTNAVSIAQLGSNNSTMRNRIINGDMRIDQRNAGASSTPSNGQYVLDRWQHDMSVNSKFSVQQSSTAPDGFTKSLLVTSLSSYSLTFDDYFTVTQPIEGFNTADLSWGTANAKTVTLSFWVRSSLTGVFGGSLMNNDFNRSYPFTYTINSANTWEYKTITVPGDTIGTWVTGNTTGIQVHFGLGGRVTYSGTANAWAAGLKFTTTGSTRVVSTNGATWYVTGVQLEAGSQATPFEYRQYGTELQLCYRYCYALYKGDNIFYATGGYYSSTDVRTQVQLPVTMRTTPSSSYTGYSSFYRNGTLDSQNVNSWVQNYPNNNTVQFYSGNSMSGTAGQIGWLYSGGGGQLIFLAEL